MFSFIISEMFDAIAVTCVTLFHVFGWLVHVFNVWLLPCANMEGALDREVSKGNLEGFVLGSGYIGDTWWELSWVFTV